MTDTLEQLAASFPKEAIHWRAQQLTKKGDKAMALAYLDARDIMDRLDAVLTPQGWQAIHYDCGGGRLACKIGIFAGTLGEGGEWIWKSDGAGGTQVEAEKGAFSGALKRAGVMWGIGRYLYALPTPWVPCETYEGRDGKRRFSKFTEDPWSYCKGIPGGVYPGDESGADSLKTSDVSSLPRNEQEWKAWSVTFKTVIDGCNTAEQITASLKAADATLTGCKKASAKLHEHVMDYAQGRRDVLETPTDNTVLGAG